MTGSTHPHPERLDVLVVDDGQIMADTTADILRSVGFVVAVAANLDQAHEVVASRPVGTVILDHHLRGENGESFLTRGRKLPPVIVISGMGQEVLKAYETIYGDKVYACLAKPVPPVDLINTVIGALAG
jgi:DNA-binding response OmpR family regulator